MKIALFVALFAATTTSAQQQVVTPFESYQAEFWKSVTDTFGTEVVDQANKSGVFASNNFLNRSMGLAFEKSQIHLEATIPKAPLNPQPSSVDLTVKKVFKSCDLCPKCDLSPTHWGGCFCDAATLGLRAVCETTNLLLNTFGGITFGRASFHDVSVSASAQSSPLTIQFDPSLTTAQLVGTVAAHGEAEGKIDWTWTSLAGLFTACPPQTISVPPTGVNLSSQQMPVANILGQETTNEGLKLKLTVSGGSFKAQVPNPAPQLIQANPQLLVTCPVGFAFLVGYSVAGELIPIERDFSVPGTDLEFTLANFTVPRIAAPGAQELVIKKNNLSVGAVETPTQ